jgi:hypothetical protein
MGLMDLFNQGDIRDKLYAAASKNNVPQGGVTGAMFKGMFPHGLGNLAFGRQPEPMPPLDSPEGTAYMADLASNMAVPGTFIGPKGMSNLFGDDVARGLLSSAEAKLAQGVPKETVFSELGVFRGPEGKWRYELDDRRSGFNFGEISKIAEQNGGAIPAEYQSRLGDLYNHPKAYAAHPDLEDVAAQIRNLEHMKGVHGFEPGDSIATIKLRLIPRAALTISGQRCCMNYSTPCRTGKALRGAGVQVFTTQTSAT